jgi:hypothetical protein
MIFWRWLVKRAAGDCPGEPIKPRRLWNKPLIFAPLFVLCRRITEGMNYAGSVGVWLNTEAAAARGCVQFNLPDFPIRCVEISVGPCDCQSCLAAQLRSQVHFAKLGGYSGEQVKIRFNGCMSTLCDGSPMQAVRVCSFATPRYLQLMGALNFFPNMRTLHMLHSTCDTITDEDLTRLHIAVVGHRKLLSFSTKRHIQGFWWDKPFFMRLHCYVANRIAMCVFVSADSCNQTPNTAPPVRSAFFREPLFEIQTLAIIDHYVQGQVVSVDPGHKRKQSEWWKFK